MNVTELTAQFNISRAVREQLCLDFLQQFGSLKQKSHSLGLEDDDTVLAFERNPRMICRCQEYESDNTGK